MPARDIQLKVLLSVEEKRMLCELAEASGLSVSDYVRQAARVAHAMWIEARPRRGRRR